jgi:autotransporter-associated beta strand protein
MFASARQAVALLIPALLAMGSLPASAADILWVGNDGFNNSNFSASGNWQNNTLPTWSSSNSLIFSQNQNANVTGLVYDLSGWQPVDDIKWAATFPVARTLSSSNGNGIDFRVRIENNSSSTQTVTMNTSGGKSAAPEIQLNPVKASLILSGTIYNDNSVDYLVYGGDGVVTNLTLNTELGPNAPNKPNVDFTVAGGRTTAIQVNASQSWAGTTTVNSGIITAANGVTLASSAFVLVGGTFATTSANTLADAATLTVNSGRFSIGGSDTVASLVGSGGSVDIASGATLTAGNAGSTSYAGSITGSGGFTKVGSGAMTLSGNNTYSGGALVSQGTLVGNASTSFGTGSIVLGDGNTGTSSIVLIANNSGNTTIANAITVANLGTGLVSIGGTNTGAGSVNVWNGTLTLNRNVQVFADTTPGSSGRTSFLGQITGSGGITVTQGRVTLQNGTNNFTGPVVVNSGATLQLDVGGGLNEVIPNSAAVTVNGALNFASGGGTETIGSLSGSGTVSSVVAGTYRLVVGGSTNTTFSGVINNGDGVIGLTKSGAGTLTLIGSNGFTGGAALNAGTLAVGSANALGSSGAISFGGGTLQYSASNTTDYSGRFSNAASQQYSIDTNGQTVTLGSNLTSSGGSFTKLGAGGVTLSGNNSYSAGTLVSQGALIGSNSTSFGSGAIVLGDGNTGTNGIVLMANTVDNTTITNAITVANLGTGLVSIGGTNTGASTVNAWTGTLTLNRNVQVFNDTPHAGGRTSFIGQITGSGGITVTQGRGRVTLQNTTNNFTGPVVVDSGATLQLDVATGLNEVIPNSAAVTVNGALNFASGGGTETIGSLAGSGTVSAGVSGTYRLVVGGSNSGTFSGAINNGSGVIGLTKSGAGTLLLTGSNGFTAGAALNGGTLGVGSANALGSSGTISFGGGTLQFSASNTTDYSGRFSNAASQQYSIDTNGRNVTLASNLTSSGGSFTKLGSGTLTLAGANSYNGGTTISAGRLVGTTSTSLPGNIVNNAEVEFVTNGGNYSFSGNVSGTGTLIKSGGDELVLDGVNSYTGGTIVTAGTIFGTPDSLQGPIANGGVVAFAGSGAYAGVISGVGSLEVRGGDIAFGGTSAYTGATTVLGGSRMSVNGGLGNTAVSVQGGGTLGGSGSIGGPVLVDGLGTLSPGNSIASLAVGATTFTGTSEFVGGSTFEYEYDSSAALSVGADLLVVSGNLTIESGAVLTLADLAGSPTPFADYSTIFALINYSGAWNNGLFTFNGTTLADGSRFFVGSQEWEIDYNRPSSTGLANYTGDYLPSSSFIAITAVPEPTTIALTGVAALALGAGAIRRARKARQASAAAV